MQCWVWSLTSSYLIWLIYSCNFVDKSVSNSILQSTKQGTLILWLLCTKYNRGLVSNSCKKLLKSAEQWTWTHNTLKRNWKYSVWYKRDLDLSYSISLLNYKQRTWNYLFLDFWLLQQQSQMVSIQIMHSSSNSIFSIMPLNLIYNPMGLVKNTTM